MNAIKIGRYMLETKENDGIDGYDGIDGFEGIDRFDGIDGSEGIDGSDGIDGSEGIDTKDESEKMHKVIRIHQKSVNDRFRRKL